MTRLVVDRLWPVLTVLALLLAGALALESYAARRGNDPLRVTISDVGGVADDEEGGGDPADEGPAAPALSALHAAARREARRARFGEAIPLYEKALAEHPGSAAVEGELGALLLAAGRPEQALPHLVRADVLAPGPHTALRVGLARARLDDEQGAEADLRRALALRPSSNPARVALGNLLRRRGRAEEAAALLQAATQSGSNEERARALVALGAAWLSMDRRADAEKAFEHAIQYAPARAEIRLGIARAWLGGDGKRDVERAMQVLLRAADMAPDVPQVQSALGRAQERAGDPAAAAESYDRALRLDPANRYARRRMLRLALQRRDFARARHEAERLVSDAPDVPEHLFLAALVADREGRRDDARRGYRKAIEAAKGNYPEAYLNLGVLEKGAGDAAAARAAYDAALRLRPRYPAAWSNIAKLEEAAGDVAAAEAAYSKAIELDERFAPAWLGRGQLRSEAGRAAEAIDDLTRAAAARPGYDAAELSLGVAYARAGRPADAVATYRRLLERSPRYVSAWLNLGIALEATGRLGEARDAFTRAADLDPQHAESREELAEMDLAAGRVAEAKSRFGEVLELAPDHVGARAGLAEIAALQGDRRGCEERARALRAEAGADERVRRLAQRCAASAATPAR